MVHKCWSIKGDMKMIIVKMNSCQLQISLRGRGLGGRIISIKVLM